MTIGPLLKYFELRGGLDLSHAGLHVDGERHDNFQSLVPGGLPEMAEFDETFIEFLPTFFTGLDRFTWGHLWFVAYLFTFSLIYLPLMLRLVRSSREGRDARPRDVYLPLVVLVAVQVLLRPHWPGVQNLYDDWANFAYYSTYLFAGFLLACSPRLERVLDGERRRALAVAVAATGVLLAGVLGAFDTERVMLAGSAVAGWCYVVAILGYAREALTRDGPVMHYLRESAFPVYILHQLALVVVGYLVVQLSLGIATKFVLVVSCALAATMLFYHFVVRRVPVLRFAYGMKPQPTAPRRGALSAATGAAVLAGLALAALATRAGAAADDDPRGVWWARAARPAWRSVTAAGSCGCAPRSASTVARCSTRTIPAPSCATGPCSGWMS